MDDILTWLMTEPPRWEGAKVSPMVTAYPLATSMPASMRDAVTLPWPPTPVMMTL
jgi:hypothetical protein